MARDIEQILHVDASQRRGGSVSRALSKLLVDELQNRFPAARVVRQDLGNGVPLVEDRWMAANNTPEHERSAAQRETLAHSDGLVEQLRSADLWVIGTPIYNFSLPPVLKAWIDQVCRARVTFAYSEQGPRGLLDDRKVFLTIASGGSRVGSETEFLTPYLRHVLGFIGIRDVEIIAADQLLMAGEEKIAQARQQVRDAVKRL
jgi:FMN-dependent NADH-azoreductase